MGRSHTQVAIFENFVPCLEMTLLLWLAVVAVVCCGLLWFLKNSSLKKFSFAIDACVTSLFSITQCNLLMLSAYHQNTCWQTTTLRRFWSFFWECIFKNWWFSLNSRFSQLCWNQVPPRGLGLTPTFDHTWLTSANDMSFDSPGWVENDNKATRS